MFALLGERADAGAAKAALTTATMTTPMRILHLRIARKRYTCHKSDSRPVAEAVSLRPGREGWHTAGPKGIGPALTTVVSADLGWWRTGAGHPGQARRRCGVGGLEIGHRAGQSFGGRHDQTPGERARERTRHVNPREGMDETPQVPRSDGPRRRARRRSRGL